MRNSAESFWRELNGAEIQIERYFKRKVCEICNIFKLDISSSHLNNNVNSQQYSQNNSQKTTIWKWFNNVFLKKSTHLFLNCSSSSKNSNDED